MIHKDVILAELSRRMQEVLRKHGAPLRISVLLEKIPYVKVDPSLDPYYQDPDPIEYEGQYKDLTTVPIYEDHMNDLISQDRGNLFYKTFHLVGLTSFFQKDIIHLVCLFLSRSENNTANLEEIINHLKTEAKTSLLNLPTEENFDWIAELVFLVKQFPKLFQIKKATKEIVFVQKADLLTSSAEIIWKYGESFDKPQKFGLIAILINKPKMSKWSADYPINELLQKLNASEKYFKDFQEEVTLDDLMLLNSLNKNLFSVFNDNGELFIAFDLLKWVSQKISENFNKMIKVPEKGKRIYVYKFKGNNFPLQEATDYLKIRPYIFIKEVIWQNTNEHPDLFDPNPEEELWKYLRSLVPDNKKFHEWIKENISVSWIDQEDAIDYLEDVYSVLIEEYSPIFNVDNNPGNLFKYTLQEKLVNYEAVKK